MDVFLSCADEDAHRATQIMSALRQSDIAVALAHPAQQTPRIKAVARVLTSAKCVLVLWSSASLENELGKAEADYAKERGLIVSVMIDRHSAPAKFGDEWSADLTNWPGDLHSDDFRHLKQLITKRLAARPHAAPAPPVAPAPSRSSTIFLCYRREDTQDAAGRLHDRLVDAYGPERVFRDIDSVPLGVDFVDHVAVQISRCSAVIVMIGRQWLKLKNKRRRRRLDDEGDLVRVEIASALKQNVPVIPVLVQDAAMPDPDDLPDNIRPLVRRNGIELSATRWRTDVERLIKELDRVMKP
jgi:hypothetical protein